MPLWPFKLRRRKPDMERQETSGKQPLAERSQNAQAAAVQPSPSTAAEREAQQGDMIGASVKSPPRSSATDKENQSRKLRRGSVESITALPTSYQLHQSPHLRPADAQRAEIPYNFRDVSSAGPAASSTSVGRPEASSSKPATLRSKRSMYDAKSMKRRSSQKRKEDYLREEEIRAMSATMPVPKRPGDGPLRRDSYKRRTFGSTADKETSIRSPVPEESIPPVPGLEQNGYEVQQFWYNPRPTVRLSSVPAYTMQSASQPSMPLPRDISQKLKGKQAAKESTKRRLKTVGADADELDSTDLRAVLERDAKRREKREQDRKDRIDRKLRETSRRRASSSRKRKDTETDKAIEAGEPPVPQLQRPDVSRAQSSIHPALRDEPVLKDADVVGLDIRDKQDDEAVPEDPFKDPIAEHRAETERQLEQGPIESPFQDSAVENPFEDSVIETAREVRMSTATTPPLSPVDRKRRSSGKIPIEDLTTASPTDPVPEVAPASAAAAAAAAAAQPPTRSPTSPTNRRSGSERRGGAWASFFKRGGTQKETKSPDMAFANTSRESMSRQPLPPHLVTERVSPFQRTSTGTPTRTMSKFREDLPDAPLSPPDSRVQSPELPANAAAIAAAAAAAAATNEQHHSTLDHNHQEASDERDSAIDAGMRSDTPVSPGRGHAPMSASLASVDSEGSWLAGGTAAKRASQQSGLTRSLGSLTRRTPEFNASFEDLGAGGDKDAEYVLSTAEARRSSHLNRLSGSAVAGASADDEGTREAGVASVHDSVRRKPTLVHRDPAIRSREGLLSEYAEGEDKSAQTAIRDDSADDDEDQVGAKLESARSIDYGKRHARQVSAGSAKLLDVAPRRMSATPATPVSPTMHAPASPKEADEDRST